MFFLDFDCLFESSDLRQMIDTGAYWCIIERNYAVFSVYCKMEIILEYTGIPSFGILENGKIYWKIYWKILELNNKDEWPPCICMCV